MEQPVINLRTMAVGSAVALALGLSPLAAAPARADALSGVLGNYSGHFNDMEDVYNPTTGAITSTPAIGDQVFGIEVLGSITSSLGPGYSGATGGATDYAVAVFGGVNVDAFVSNATGSVDTTPGDQPGFGDTVFTKGGQINIYDIPAIDFANVTAFNNAINATSDSGLLAAGCGGPTLASVAAGTAGFCYNGLTNASGATDMLNLALAPSTSTVITTVGPVSPPGGPYDLTETLNGTISGNATAWANVNGGTDAAKFANAAELTPIGTLTDVSVAEEFCPESTTCAAIYAGSPNTGWTIASSDPFNGTAVPEPGTLALFGSQLLGLGVFAGWRRKRRAA
jgi:hypothetical protein